METHELESAPCVFSLIHLETVENETSFEKASENGEYGKFKVIEQQV